MFLDSLVNEIRSCMRYLAEHSKKDTSLQVDEKHKARVRRALVGWTCLLYVMYVVNIAFALLIFMLSAHWMVKHALNLFNGIPVLLVPLAILIGSLMFGHRFVVSKISRHRTNIFKTAFTRVAFQQYFEIMGHEIRANLSPLIRCSGVCCRDWGKMRVNDQVTGFHKGLRFLLLDLCLTGGFRTLFQGQLFIIELPKSVNWRSFDIQTEIVNVTHDFESTAAMQNELFREEFVFSYPEQKAGMLNVLRQYGFDVSDAPDVRGPGAVYTPDELLNDDFASCLVSLRARYSGIFVHVQRNYLFVAVGGVDNDGEDLFEPGRLDIFRSYDRIECRVRGQVAMCADVLDKVICATHMVPDRVETVLEMDAADVSRSPV